MKLSEFIKETAASLKQERVYGKYKPYEYTRNYTLVLGGKKMEWTERSNKESVKTLEDVLLEFHNSLEVTMHEHDEWESCYAEKIEDFLGENLKAFESVVFDEL